LFCENLEKLRRFAENLHLGEFSFYTTEVNGSGGGFFLGTDDTTFYKKRHGLLLEKAVSLE
jgi:hypothetical protein